MWPVSARWGDAVRQSRGLVVQAQVWRAGVYTGVDLDVDGGSVRVDETSKVRRSGRLSVTGSSDPGLRLEDGSLVPRDADDFLSPVDTDVTVLVGHRYAEGDTELVPVLTGRLVTPGRDSQFGPLSVDVTDYAGVLATSRFVGTWNTPVGVTVVSEITRMVQDVLPWVEVYDLTGSTAMTSPAAWEKQRWDAIANLASGIAAEPVFDPLGRLILRPVPDGTASPVWTMDTGTPTAIVEDAKTALDLSGVYNAVQVSSSDTDSVGVTATVYQMDGPLRWRRGFKRVRYFASPILKTVEACQAAAFTLLPRSLIYAETIEPTIVPDPALDAGDTGTVLLPHRDPVTRVLSSFTIPLDPDGQRMPTVLRAGVTGEVASTDDLREVS